MRTVYNKISTKLTTIFLLAALFITVAVMNIAMAVDDQPETTFDGLQLIPESKVDAAYVRFLAILPQCQIGSRKHAPC